MSLNVRLPENRGGSVEEQLGQLRSFLFQLARQLETLPVAYTENPGNASGSRGTARPGSVSPAAAFANLKPLIIKSADIVEAYSQQIQRKLEGHFLAQSRFGNYEQTTSQEILENSQEIRRSFQQTQRIESRVSGVESGIEQVNAYVKTGLLTTDDRGVPIYGIEIGQQETVDGAQGFRKYARLASQRLSFYDGNNQEVAYISDRMLTVTSAGIRQLTAKEARVDSLHLGGYVLKTTSDGHLQLC